MNDEANSIGSEDLSKENAVDETSREVWVVVVDAGPAHTERLEVTVETSRVDGVDGWLAGRLDEYDFHALSPRAAVTRVASACSLSVLEILSPEEMSREEEVQQATLEGVKAGLEIAARQADASLKDAFDAVRADLGKALRSITVAPVPEVPGAVLTSPGNTVPIAVDDFVVDGVEPREGYELRYLRYPQRGNIVVPSAFTPSGAYLGDEEMAVKIVTSGIAPEVCHPDPARPMQLCTIGFGAWDQRWYGWSRRAMRGFGIGFDVNEANVALLGDKFPMGFVALTLDDCRRMACAFAETVS